MDIMEQGDVLAEDEGKNDVPSLPPIPPMSNNTLDLRTLTEEEEMAIRKVIDRDAREMEVLDNKISVIRKEINDIRKRGALTKGDNQNTMCARCKHKFWLFPLPFVDKGVRCIRCKFRVCMNCRQKQINNTWLCILCYRYREEKIMSGEWMFKGRCIGMYGSDLMRCSLRDKEKLLARPKPKKPRSRPRAASGVSRKGRKSHSQGVVLPPSARPSQVGLQADDKSADGAKDPGEIDLNLTKSQVVQSVIDANDAESGKVDKKKKDKDEKGDKKDKKGDKKDKKDKKDKDRGSKSSKKKGDKKDKKDKKGGDKKKKDSGKPGGDGKRKSKKGDKGKKDDKHKKDGKGGKKDSKDKSKDKKGSDGKDKKGKDKKKKDKNASKNVNNEDETGDGLADRELPIALSVTPRNDCCPDSSLTSHDNCSLNKHRLDFNTIHNLEATTSHPLLEKKTKKYLIGKSASHNVLFQTEPIANKLVDNVEKGEAIDLVDIPFHLHEEQKAKIVRKSRSRRSKHQRYDQPEEMISSSRPKKNGSDSEPENEYSGTMGKLYNILCDMKLLPKSKRDCDKHSETFSQCDSSSMKGEQTPHASNTERKQLFNGGMSVEVERLGESSSVGMFKTVDKTGKNESVGEPAPKRSKHVPRKCCQLAVHRTSNHTDLLERWDPAVKDWAGNDSKALNRQRRSRSMVQHSTKYKHYPSSEDISGDDCRKGKHLRFKQNAYTSGDSYRIDNCANRMDPLLHRRGRKCHSTNRDDYNDNFQHNRANPVKKPMPGRGPPGPMGQPPPRGKQMGPPRMSPQSGNQRNSVVNGPMGGPQHRPNSTRMSASPSAGKLGMRQRVPFNRNHPPTEEPPTGSDGHQDYGRTGSGAKTSRKSERQSTGPNVEQKGAEKDKADKDAKADKSDKDKAETDEKGGKEKDGKDSKDDQPGKDDKKETEKAEQDAAKAAEAAKPAPVTPAPEPLVVYKPIEKPPERSVSSQTLAKKRSRILRALCPFCKVSMEYGYEF